MTINNHLHGKRHPTVTVIVTEKTAWVSGLLSGVTLVMKMTVICGHVLSGWVRRAARPVKDQEEGPQDVSVGG